MTDMQDKRAERQLNALAARFKWKVKDARIGPVLGFTRGSQPLAGSRAEMLDQTGKRITVTRLVTLGPFALAAKKRTGETTVLVVSPEGSLRATTKKAAKAFEFVTLYNAFVGAAQDAGGEQVT
jgi:hypothetical protein